MLRLRLPVVATLVTAFSALALVTGCPPDEGEDDDTPPRVLGVEPAVPVVPVTATFRVIFSEELNEDTVSGEVTADNLTVVLVPRDLVNDTFLSDINNPPLSESRQDDVVPIVVAVVDGGKAVSVQPRADLAPGTAYSLILSADIRDTAGNPLVDAAGLKAAFIYEFTTDAGPPAVLSTDIGASGVVVPNRKRITVTFNQPVIGVDTGSLRIDGAPAPVVESLLMNEERTTATIVLDLLGGGCERLGLNADYTLAADASITSDVGQPMEPYTESFSASGSCDVVANAMSDVQIIASDISATIRFTSTKPSTTEVRYGRAGGALDCEGNPCPVVGAPTTAANAVHAVTLSPLTVNIDYIFVAFAEDEVGLTASASGAFRTEPLPRIAVNEAMQDADATFVPESTGEYIEIASYDPIPISLIGWSLRTTKVSGGTPDECDMPADAPTINDGEFLVIADDTFNEAGYPPLSAASVVRIASMCTMNNEALIIELIDPGGRPVSSMTTPDPDAGESFERLAVDAPDEAANVCPSRADTGPTPGAENGIVARGCE